MAQTKNISFFCFLLLCNVYILVRSQGHDWMAALRRTFDVSLSRISRLFHTFYNLKFSRARLGGCTPAYIRCIAVEDKPVLLHFCNLSRAWLNGCTPACIRCIAVEDKPVVFHFRTISQGHDWMAALQRTFDVSLSRISQLLYTSYDMSIDSIVIIIVLRLVYRWIFWFVLLQYQMHDWMFFLHFRTTISRVFAFNVSLSRKLTISNFYGISSKIDWLTTMCIYLNEKLKSSFSQIFVSFVLLHMALFDLFLLCLPYATAHGGKPTNGGNAI